MTGTVMIRTATPADYHALAEVMFDAVRNGPTAYSPAQLAAWVPEVRRGLDWEQRLAGQIIYLAEQDQRVVGFMSLARGGYIDFAYIRPDHQGTGLFRRLFQSIESAARTGGQTRLWVHASLMAHHPFAAHGFEVVEEQLVKIGSQVLRRYEMQKLL